MKEDLNLGLTIAYMVLRIKGCIMVFELYVNLIIILYVRNNLIT